MYPLSFGGRGVKARQGVVGSATLAGTGQITVNRRRAEASLQLQQLTVLFPVVPGAPSAAPAQTVTTPPARTTLTAPVQLSTEIVDNEPFNGPQPVPAAALAGDHYRCYRVTRVKGSLSSGTVRLSDQFGTTSGTFGGPTEVCNPVLQSVPSRRLPRNATRHLVSYAMATRGSPSSRSVSMRDQVAPPRARRPLLTTGGLNHLLVPSSKVRLKGPGRKLPSRASRSIGDHFACYRATPSRQPGRRRLAWADQFDRRILRPRTIDAVCNPTTKTFAGRTTQHRSPAAHLTSYTLAGFSRSVPRTARITNQFGTKEVTTGNATRILVVSAKRHCARFRAQGLGIPVVTTSPGRILARIASIELVPYRGNGQGACPD